MNYREYKEYQERQIRRRDGLRWDKGSTFLLSGAVSLVLFAFVFYDHPITNNDKIFSYLRASQTTGVNSAN